MSDTDDDDTVPTGRAGVDPLIAYPLESTGSTGQIERPGDGTPWWFIPAMFAVALGFIGLWVAISESRSGDDVGSPGAAAVAESSDQTSPDVAAAGAAGATGSAATGTDGPAAEPPAAPTTTDARIAELPPPGVVRIGGSDYDLVSSCEVHLPYEPADTETQVSSYFFFDDSGARGLVERTVDAENDTATRAIEGTLTASPDVVEIGDAGAFSSSFVGGEVLVNPPVRGGDACRDRVVTNAPGRFAEPHTRIVMDVCTEERGLPQGTTISGFTSEGSRFEIQQAGGELAEIIFEREPDDRLRTSAPATILRTEEQFSASGVVSNGVEDLDLTIDVSASNIDGARACTASDRL